MLTKSWLYDSIIYIYTLSLLFSFSDAVSKSDGAKRMGAGLLIFVWILQTVFICIRIYEHRYVPVLTRFETLFFFSWLLVTVSLVASRFIQMQFVVFFVNVVAFTVLVLNLLTDPGVASVQFEASGELSWLHVALALVSYAAFAVSAVLSSLYLFLYNRLKGKKWSQALRRMPSLESLEKHLITSALVGTPMLILSLSLGVVWLSIEYDVGALFVDVKVYSTLIVLAMYGWLFILKMKYQSTGYRLASWNVFSFVVLLLNFAFSNNYSQIHQWFQ